MVEYVQYKEAKGPKLYRIGKYSFSTKEVKHLLIALCLITIALMVLQRGLLAQVGVVTFVIVYLITVGLGFLLHELGHKLVAQYYGFVSEFRADFMMMLVAIIISWFGFLFLAPGAVMVLGRPSIKQNGIISVAGPVVNLVLAVIFILLQLIIQPVATSFWGVVFSLGIWVNAFLGVFNMLPIWVLDGKKVWAWNKMIYGVVMGALLLILFGSLFGVF